MRELEPITVITYSGGKGVERPQIFFYNNHRFEIEMIIFRAYEITHHPRAVPKRIFRVSAEGREFTLIYDEATLEWYLERERGEL
ncbi:MAG: hypothetical protein J7L64_00030 [Acidobacteria bacterium]|nr:hypothetical protein [Acidobacteriota bacterium]